MSPPAFRLAANCPQCGAPLVARDARQHHSRFIGCSRFPSCRFTAQFDEALQQLGHEMEVLRGERDLARRELALARFPHPLPTRPHTELDRELKQLLAVAHPDKWEGKPATALAHEFAVQLNHLRKRLGVT